MKDGKNDIDRVEVIAAAALGLAPVDSSAVTLDGFEKLTFSAGSVASAAGILTLVESDTLAGAYTAVPADETIGTQGVALVNGSIVSLGYAGSKGFVKAQVDLSVDGVVYVVAEKSQANVSPNSTN